MPEIQLLANPGFETGSLAPWLSTGMVTVETAPPDNAHTGTKSVKLESDTTTSASISQTVLVPLLPGSSLHLSFFMRRDKGTATNITAEVTLLTPFPVPFITISIPAASNPGTNKDEWEYYEGFSPPLLLPAFGATVTITVAAVPKGADAEIFFDDIFLYNDI